MSCDKLCSVNKFVTLRQVTDNYYIKVNKILNVHNVRLFFCYEMNIGFKPSDYKL